MGKRVDPEEFVPVPASTNSEGAGGIAEGAAESNLFVGDHVRFTFPTTDFFRAWGAGAIGSKSSKLHPGIRVVTLKWVPGK